MVTSCLWQSVPPSNRDGRAKHHLGKVIAEIREQIARRYRPTVAHSYP